MRPAATSVNCVYAICIAELYRQQSVSQIWVDNIKMDIQEVGCGVWTGSSWLRIGTGGGHL